MPKKGIEPVRREQLIRATFQTIDEMGLADTTVATIARNAGARVHQDGSESQAYLQLPPAGLDTRMSKIVAEHFGEVDYQLKKQARQFWSLLADMQEIRQGVQDGRHQAAE